MMEIIDKDGWPDIYRRLHPGADPNASEGQRLRGRVNEIAFEFAASRAALKDPRPSYDFAQYAEFGEIFLRGVQMGHAWLNLVAGALSSDPKRHSTAWAPDPTAIAAIVKQIEILKGLKAFEDRTRQEWDTGEEEAFAPNSKPWLHTAIAALRLLWNDEGQTGRPKKDFLEFAEAIVGGVFGVTSNSILESYDRHSHQLVADRIATRAEWQQGDAKRRKAIDPK